MEEGVEEISINDANKVLESPKPTAFTIDFNEGRPVSQQRHKHFVEKYQKRHRRGESLSKIEDVAHNNHMPAKPQSAQLPRKLSTPTEKEVVNDEKTDKIKAVRSGNQKLRDGLTLPLKNKISDRMTQSCTLPEGFSYEVSTPELEAVKPPSPIRLPSPEPVHDHLFHPPPTLAIDFDLDKSDNVSDAGTYTIDNDNYSEEQKARMSIDREFEIESISVYKKTHDYVQSLSNSRSFHHEDEEERMDEILVPTERRHRLSPIVSPTQNFTLNGDEDNDVTFNKSFNKIMFPSAKSRTGIGSVNANDQGCVISITSSGAFRSKSSKAHARKLSLTKSEVQVEAYTDNVHVATEVQRVTRNLSANLVLVSENLPKTMNRDRYRNDLPHGYEELVETNVQVGKVVNLPPTMGGPGSGRQTPTKIPSPIHASRPRSRSSTNSLNIDLSDSSLETESYLKPTQNLLNTLQQRLSLDSDHDSGNDAKFLNNDARNLLKKPTHLRHNSLDERNLKISNKLEHFQNKKFIDQTNVLNQYAQSNKVHKIQNSPNDSPIRRSSSFSTKNQLNSNKLTNVTAKESNLRNSPAFSRNGSIQRSSSTAAVRPNVVGRRSAIEHKIERYQFGDTESSSEDDLLQNLKKKDITATRYNRAFSLRRARADQEASNVVTTAPKCPNTPEMRRKFVLNDGRAERAISVDRKPAVKAPDVQSRYLQNLTKNRVQPKETQNVAVTKSSPKIGNTATKPAPKAQVFSRTDSGRFSMRSNKPPVTNSQKTIRSIIPGSKKPSGPRSNSSLTSKEVEFQNWKRRKSYDPMKAAAEGKRKVELARKQVPNPMTQSYHEANQDCDSSPSHSSSVHRSQSFHGTAALEQYISSEDEDDLTLSQEEGFSPPTPSPCNLSPGRNQLRSET